MALRGDPVGGVGTRYAPHPDGYRNAADLVAGIKRIPGIEVSVSAYPEKHPDSPSVEADIDMLAAKVDAGASRAITQFFFDSDHYFRYLDRVRARGITIPIVPGILPVQNFKQTRAFAERCGTSVPDWLADRFAGLDGDAATRKLIAAAVAAEQVLGPRRPRRDRLPLLHHEPRRPRLRHLPSARRACGPGGAGGVTVTSSSKASPVEAELRSRAAEAILVLDGAMGTEIQDLKLGEAGYRGERFADWPSDLRGNNDILILSQPDAVRQLHLNYFRAGADIVSTNTFSSTRIAQADYGAQDFVAELNLTGARLAKEAAAIAAREDGRPRFVAGAMGPTNRTASISPDVSNPGFRAVTFDELREAYGEQAKGLVEGGADLLLLETIFDTLNAKAALYAIARAVREPAAPRVPVMISGTITDLSGRMLSGQTPEAFWISIEHAAPFSVGLNCALGAKEMRAHIADIARVADTLDLRLSQCRPAQRVRPLRREPRIHGGASRRVRRCRPRQHRRRLLRHDAGPHPRHRRGGARQAAAQAADAARALRLSGLEPFVLTPDIPLRQCRRAHQRHRLGALPQADHGRRLSCRARRSPATRSRTAPR